MRYRIWCVARFTPRFLREAPYRFGFWWLRRKLAKNLPQARVGYRNSLFLRRIEPVLSDLDVTVIAPSSNLKQAHQLFLETKRTLPFLGELNLYSHEGLSSALESINPCERARDPLLPPTHQPTLAEKLVFVSRMLEADKENLVRIPQARQQKWQGHLRDLGWAPISFVTRDALIEIIAHKMNRRGSAQLIHDFLNLKSPSHESPLVDEALIQALFLNRVCYRPPSPRHDALTREMIQAQVKWESWASRSVPDINQNEWQPHLERMRHFADQLGL